jgi:hypothetical protein
MNTDPTQHPAPHSNSAEESEQPSLLWQAWTMVQFIASLAVTCLALAYLILVPAAAEEAEPPKRPPEPAQITGKGLIRIPEDSTLHKRITVADAVERSIRSPVVRVTGTVAASMRPGKDGNDFWQFNAPEVLTAYADWQKASADVVFNTTQLEKVKELAAARESAQKKLVERLTNLVRVAKTDPEKDLAAEQANLIQMQLTARKDIHEATNAISVAKRTEAALTRQLQQNGLDPQLLKKGNRDMDIVIADVPESRLADIEVDKGCEARFFGLPNTVFKGKVQSIAPVLAKERRTLRVLFVLEDPMDQLRPGMFAEIGLGTDPRDRLLVPAEAVVHVGGKDYVLVLSAPGLWRSAPVTLGENYNGEIEVKRGVRKGDKVIADGAVLLKSFIIEATKGGKP